MEALNAACTPPRRKLFIKALSVGAGSFLLLAGLLGSLFILVGGGITYFIGAL